MYHLDIPKTRQYDTGKIEVIARSSVGEALATADLKIVPRSDDYRGVLKNSPRRKYSFCFYEKKKLIMKIDRIFWFDLKTKFIHDNNILVTR